MDNRESNLRRFVEQHWEHHSVCGQCFWHSKFMPEEDTQAGRHAVSDRLVKVALEEVAHYVTGAGDNSRDFQDFVLEVAVKLARKCEGVSA